MLAFALTLGFGLVTAAALARRALVLHAVAACCSAFAFAALAAAAAGQSLVQHTEPLTVAAAAVGALLGALAIGWLAEDTIELSR